VTCTGIIYGYRVQSTKRWAYVGQTTATIARCHKRHRQKNRSLFEHELRARLGTPSALEGPIVLEKIMGTGPRDLGFNLDFQECIWIFKCKTLCSVWPEGLNQVAFIPAGRSRSTGHRSKRAGSVAQARQRGKRTGGLWTQDPGKVARVRTGAAEGRRRLKERLASDPEFAAEYRRTMAEVSRKGRRAFQKRLATDAAFRKEFLRKAKEGSVKGANKSKELFATDLEFRARIIEGGRRGLERVQWLIKHDAAFRARYLQQQQINSTKGNKKLMELMATDPAFAEQQRLHGQKGAEGLKKRLATDPEFAEQWRLKGVKNGEKARERTRELLADPAYRSQHRLNIIKGQHRQHLAKGVVHSECTLCRAAIATPQKVQVPATQTRAA
jgi:hypothetical protein